MLPSVSKIVRPPWLPPSMLPPLAVAKCFVNSRQGFFLLDLTIVLKIAHASSQPLWCHPSQVSRSRCHPSQASHSRCQPSWVSLVVAILVSLLLAWLLIVKEKKRVRDAKAQKTSNSIVYLPSESRWCHPSLCHPRQCHPCVSLLAGIFKCQRAKKGERCKSAANNNQQCSLLNLPCLWREAAT
jgi:hypothetical protein